MGFAAILALSLLLPSSDGHAQSNPENSSLYQDKVQLEGQLEQRVSGVLTEILGPGRFSVLINVELLSRDERESREILPGVPIQETMARGAILRSRTRIKKLSATLYLDKAVGDDEVQMVRRLVQDVLGIPENSEELRVERASFHRKAEGGGGAGWLEFAKTFASDNVVKVLWIVALFMLMAQLQRAFLKPFLGAFQLMATSMTAKKEEVDRGPQDGYNREAYPMPGQRTPQMSADLVGAHGGNGNGNGHKNGVPFSFLEPKHLKKLEFLLKGEDPRIITVVVSYLAPDLASSLLQSLEADVRLKVLKGLGAVHELPQTKVKELEKQIKNRIDFIIGGHEQVARILELASPEDQQTLLEEIEDTDPELGDALRRKVFLFEDIGRLEAPDILDLMRDIPIPRMAQILLSDEAFKDAVFKKITGGFAERLKQEMQYAKELTKDQLADEQKKIMAAVRERIADGRIRINKDDVEAAGADEGAL